MSEYNYESGGASSSIVPSARRSIHNHLNCPFANTSNTMVTYGLNKDTDDSSSEQGVDEVDNIQSKPVYPLDSPIQRSQKRNSLTQVNNYADDDDINALSKSMPAALPSYSNYRVEDQENHSPNASRNRDLISPNRSGNLNSPNRKRNLSTQNRYIDNSLNRNKDFNSQNRNRGVLNSQQRNRDFSPNISYQNLNTSNISQSSASNSPQGRRNSYTSRSTNTSNLGHILGASQLYIEKEGSSLGNTSIISILSIVAILISVYLSTQSFNVSNVTVSKYDESMFLTDLSGLGEKYNVDEDSILKLQMGISTIVDKQDTGSFIFVYNSDVDNFNNIEFNNFMHEISFAASKYLRNDSIQTTYTTVEGKKLDMKEHCELITRYRPDLERSGLILLWHVEEVPSDLAMAFHYYCDEYNPLVKKSAIFFTLDLAKCPQGPGQRSHHDLIEKCLKKKWSGVATDSIGPLLTRVINVIVDVTTAF